MVNGEGLVGKVKSVSDGNAIVMLLTDQEFGVSAKARPLRRAGLDRPRRRRPRRPAARARAARQGRHARASAIVTAGTVSTRLTSLFPPGILIGTVNRVDEGEGELDRRIHVAPAADLRRLEYRRGAHEAEHRPAAPRRDGDAVTPDRPRDRPPRRARPGRLHPAADRGGSQITSSACPPTCRRCWCAPSACWSGSVPGALFGFGVGLFVDTALLQTLGDLLARAAPASATAPGRLRELRDPAHGLVPVAVGAIGTAVYAIGFSVMQFLLGVDAPVSLLLVREILLVIVLNTLLALPVLR